MKVFIKIIVHITLITFFLLSIYLVYGAWKKDFARKHYEIIQHYYPSFFLWPKRLSMYTIIYKMLVFFSLLLSIALYILFIIIEDRLGL